MLTAMRDLPALALAARKHWPAALVLTVMAALYLVAAVSMASLPGENALARGTTAGLTTLDARVPKGRPPAPEPLAFRDVAPQDALTINASVPISAEPNPAARPFLLNAAGEVDRLRSIDCLAAAIYYEAAIEATEGQRAVAQVVLNRLRHPAFPKTVCGVVFQGAERSTGCQFTFTCDGSLGRAPSPAGMARARKVAEEALAGKVYKPVGYATHYHTNWVVPYWSSSLTKLANIGTHIFYRWQGGWGRPAAFRNNYAGVEPDVRLMQRLSSVPALLPAKGIMADVQTLPGVTPDDMKGRAVMRRYEPLREQSAANRRAELARVEVPSSLRWALTGEEDAAKRTPLGSKPASTPVPAPIVAPAAGGAGTK